MVRRRQLWIAALLLMCSRGVPAQDVIGDWQGTLGVGQRQLRLILHLDKTADTTWKATLGSIDQGPDPDWGDRTLVDSVTVAGTSFKFSVAALGGTYDGKISTDGNSIAGTWTQEGSLPLTLVRATAETAWKDPAAHSVQFVTVDPNVKLEVLDWGGPSSGRTVVLVPGLGNTAHIFDVIAPKLTARYRVLGVTRRGFGSSSAPVSGYSADRLGDDVLAVIDRLAISKPVLAGHSFGGEELSSIGSRHPEKVAGLVYLDAGYSYAFYAPGIDPYPPYEPPPPSVPMPPVMRTIISAMQRYTEISVPILAIYALPKDWGPAVTDEARVQMEQAALKAEGQAKAFENGVPTAHVVRIPRANHYVFHSNEADVLREMDAFIGRLQ